MNRTLTGRIRTSLFAALCLLGLVGCKTYDITQVNAFLQQPRSPVSGTFYRTLPPDVLAITSQHVPEINDKGQTIRPDGKINLPLVGEIMVAGRTPAEIEQDINKAAAEYYKEVDARVVVTAFNSQRYYVFGQVARPGPYTWNGHNTLLDALAQAQPTTLAWPERISVVRGSTPQEGGYDNPASKKYLKKGINPATADHPRYEMIFNLLAMIQSGDLSNNIDLLPNDVIYVRPNTAAEIGLFVQNFLFPVRSVMETVNVPAGAAGAVAMP